MIPRTMYEQCLPDNSVDLAISTVAIHYLSKQVCPIKHGVTFEEADEEERQLMSEQGEADWRAFVLSRGRELKPGGAVIVLSASCNDKGKLPSFFDEGHSVLGRIVSDMVGEGIITQDEYRATNLYILHGRTEYDFRKPFTSGLPDIKELGLELVTTNISSWHLPHRIFDIIDKDTTGKQEYSQMIVSMMFPWMHHVLYGGLSNSRSEEEKEQIITQYFDRLQTYAYNHSDSKPSIFFTEVVIKKNIKLTQHS
ncbi:uncharacterized protein [Argopecten irradians]|uniref:uncharacterized protein n=1 Tax=Argopecten irradians TaxID=31199 RepID=UPI00371C8A83